MFHFFITFLILELSIYFFLSHYILPSFSLFLSMFLFTLFSSIFTSSSFSFPSSSSCVYFLLFFFSFFRSQASHFRYQSLCVFDIKLFLVLPVLLSLSLTCCPYFVSHVIQIQHFPCINTSTISSPLSRSLSPSRWNHHYLLFPHTIFCVSFPPLSLLVYLFLFLSFCSTFIQSSFPFSPLSHSILCSSIYVYHFIVYVNLPVCSCTSFSRSLSFLLWLSPSTPSLSLHIYVYICVYVLKNTKPSNNKRWQFFHLCRIKTTGFYWSNTSSWTIPFSFPLDSVNTSFVC